MKQELVQQSQALYGVREGVYLGTELEHNYAFNHTASQPHLHLAPFLALKEPSPAH